MSVKRLLLDTGVWISYFGNRKQSEQKRIDTARNIINYCLREKIKLFYCPYVENELNLGHNLNKAKNIEEMKKIADKLPAHIGNDTWDQIDVKFEDWGSKWNNDEEVKLGNELQKQLPNKKNKSNRVDRNMVVTAVNQKINIILHENPKDYNKIDVKGIFFVDLLNIQSLNNFIEIISNI
jgi:hypothetical protein